MTSAETSAPVITLIGGGNMATAIISGLLKKNPRPRIIVSEPDAAKRAAFQERGCEATDDNAAAIRDADVVVLAIKPQMAPKAVPLLKDAWQPHQLLVSIVAGITTETFSSWLPPGAHIVRTMPNTPLAIGKGMVGLFGGPHVTDSDLNLAESLFSGCGKVLRVSDESRIDAVTAVSGSGPAYFFRFAEAMVAGAMELGFSREEAVLLVGQTGAGAWDYLLSSGFEATKLREQVTSPKGTTAAALQVIDDADFMGLMSRAMAAAEQRAKELAKS